jgi:peroxiredoxin
LLSDRDCTAAAAFGVTYRVDDAMQTRLRSKDIDLAARSGGRGDLLPTPSVFILDRAGVVRFEYVNPDYRVRLDRRVLLAAAQAVLEEMQSPAAIQPTAAATKPVQP